MKCTKCGQVKDWSGDDPECPFVGGDIFTSDNWNCGIITRIRRLCCDWEDELEGIDYQYCDDQKYATFNIAYVECDGQFIGYALWVCWYKSRGRTDAMWVLNSCEPPRPPTFKELTAIVDYYESGEGAAQRQESEER